MDDPQTFWLTITNIALGAATLLLVLAVAAGIFGELLSRAKKQRTLAGLDAELKFLFGNAAMSGKAVPTELE